MTRPSTALLERGPKRARATVTALAAHPDADWLPAPSPLDMPAQDLSVTPTWRAAGRSSGETHFWRLLSFGLTGLACWIVGSANYAVLQAGGFTPLEVVGFGLFMILFGWITYSLAVALIGFAARISSEPDFFDLTANAPTPHLNSRTAILAPVYNEDPQAVFARLAAMEASLRATGAEAAFDIFVLSDTRDPDIRKAERIAFAHLRAAAPDRFFYRWRADNHARKAGNVREWVTRFGAAYEHMVLLDADSLMEGETLVRLAAAMESHPKVGLIQTAPRLIGRASPFGRLQQFASRLYGPMLAEGLALTWGAEGNYWGHNAILRVRAFADCAGLPTLKGRKPFGGEILSHDFVEAALLRRAGWEVRLAPRLTGSYEECPPSLPDLMVRERRWCQGNLQHIMVVGARGLHPMSRFHLVHGFSAYLMAPLWFAFLILGAVLSTQEELLGRQTWDTYSLSMLNWVSTLALLSLLAPRLMAVGLTLAKPSERRAWGDVGRLVAGAALETVMSILIAPILMVGQTRSLIDILLGRDAGWSAQARADGSLCWGGAARRHVLHTMIGVALGGFAYGLSPGAFLWLTPVVTGLVLAIPLAVLTADPRLGRWLNGLGLLTTPEERDPPAVARLAEEFAADDEAGERLAA